jgi:hypothetical protein
MACSNSVAAGGAERPDRIGRRDPRDEDPHTGIISAPSRRTPLDQPVDLVLGVVVVHRSTQERRQSTLLEVDPRVAQIGQFDMGAAPGEAGLDGLGIRSGDAEADDAAACPSQVVKLDER